MFKGVDRTRSDVSSRCPSHHVTGDVTVSCHVRVSVAVAGRRGGDVTGLQR